MTVAVGTSLEVVVVNFAAGFAAHAGDTSLDYRLAGVFTLAAVAGSVVATLWGSRTRSWLLTCGLRLLVRTR